MKKTLVLLAGLAAGGAFGGRGTYVQDGLIAHWDGIDNTGTGVHDQEATVWKDLSPAGKYDLAITSKGLWGTDHLVVNGCSATYGAKGPEVLTVEFLLRHTTLPGKSGILFDAGHKNRVWVSSAAGTRYYFASTTTRCLDLPYDAMADHAISVAYSKVGSVGQVLLDGVDATSAGTVASDTNTGGGFMIGDRAESAAYPWIGNVYAVRVYNRTLSEQEMRANQTVDAIRYLDAVRTNAIVVSSWPIEAGAPSVAYGPIAKTNEETSVAMTMPTAREESDVIIAELTGWKLYSVDPQTRERTLVSQSGTDDKAAVTVNYSETEMMELEWQWSVSNRVSIVTDDPEKGTVNVENGWYAYGDTIAVEAVPEDGYRFGCWLGEVDPEFLTTASGELLAVRPYALRAAFVRKGAPTTDNVIYLSSNGDDAADGSSWATAKRTVNAAHSAAAALAGSTTILVAPGAYRVDSEIKLSEAIEICGLTDDPEDVVFHLAPGQTRFFWLDNAAAKLACLTLEGGTGKGGVKDSATALDGRGRNTYVTAGTLENCIFRGGKLGCPTASGERTTLVYLNGTSALMTRCVVTNNTMTGWCWNQNGKYATPGVFLDGGARLEYSLVANNRDTSNSKTLQDNGGVIAYNGVVDHCTVVGNWAPNAGGVCLEANGRASNCVICGNYSYNNGAATDDIAGSANNFTDCLVSVEPQSVLANWHGGDYRSAAGTEAEGKGYADAPVGFTADKVEVFTEDEVVFTAQEVDGATGYEWNFGDGSAPESGATVSHAYATAGTYAVVLSVETPSGTRIVRKANYIYVTEPTVYVDKVEDIQPAIDAQNPGGTVVLKKGRYAVDEQIEIWRDIRLVGETGKPEDVVVEIAGAPRAFHLNSPGAFVANLVSEGGTGTEWGRNCYFEHRGGTMSNCVVRGCLLAGTFNANAFAHTIFMRGPDALLTHSVITNNSSTLSGGSGSSKEMVHGVFLETGARLEHSLVADNIDSGNRSNASAKNFATVYGNGAIRNCTIVNNQCSDVGGVRLSGGSIVDSVILGNTSGGLAGEDNIYSGSASYVSSCVSEGTVTALFKDWDNKDYRPVANTALVDTGVGLEAQLPSVDLDGKPRFQNGAVDIGCYELDASQFDVTVSSAKTAYMVPAEVELSATVTGCNEGDELHYYWDFDGDGVTDLEETARVPSNTVTHAYLASGSVSVGLAVTNFTGTVKGLSVYKPDFLAMMPAAIYFDPAAPHSALPYANWDTAATNLQEAIDVAFEGMTIVVREGDHSFPSTISINKAVTVSGPSSDPNAVVFRPSGSKRMFSLNGGATLTSCVLENPPEPVTGGAVYINGGGGTISNVILRGVSYSATMNSQHYTSPIYMDGANSLATHMIVTGNMTTCNGTTTSQGIINVLAFDLRGGARVENTLMAYNSDSGRRTAAGTLTGGLVYGDGKLINCTIVSNYCKATSEVKLTAGALVNTVIAGNASDPSQDVTEPDLHEVSTNLCDHCRIGGDLEMMFADPAALNWTPKCRKGEDSLYNAGTTNGVDLPAKDLRGNPRLHGRKVDIGCYETTYGLGLSIRVK